MPRNALRKLLWILPTGLLLTNCAAGVSNGIRPVCPPLASYTAQDQAMVADEIDAAPKDAVWPGMITDYGRMRNQCRAIADRPHISF